MSRIAMLAMVFASALPAGPAGAGETNDWSVIDRIVADTKARTGMVSGTAVIVLDGTEIVHETYIGAANFDAGRPVGPGTPFYIASTTKAFLSLAVLLAEARGDLDRATTLQELFPDMHFADPAAATVTVQQLLTHTSGLENSILSWATSYTGLQDDDMRHRIIAASTMTGEPGKFSYSNLGYTTLAVWLDDRYGRDWRDTLTETVTGPLGMEHTTGFISRARADRWPLPEPYSYKVAGGTLPVYLRKTDATLYSVGLYATARDTARFVLAQMNGGELEGEQVFPAEIIAEQQRRQVATDGGYFDGYAFGWMTGTRNDQAVRFHTGGFPGASALLSFMPEEHIGLVVLHNESGLKANVLSGLIEGAVYDIALGTGPDMDAVDRQISSLAERSAQAQADLATKRTRLADAPVLMTLPAEAYTGTFTHPLAGSMQVSRMPHDLLSVQWGQLRSAAYGGDAPDQVTVEFLPGSFDTLHFKILDDSVAGVEFDGITFTPLPR